MSVTQESRGTFGAGHLISSIFALFLFKISFIAVLILGMIHSSWLHLGRPDMKHYPLTRMWQLVTSPARYALFISPGQASARLVCFKVDLAFKSTRDQQSLFTFGPVHTGYFWIRTFFFLDSASVHKWWHGESGIRIRSFSNPLSRVEIF